MNNRSVELDHLRTKRYNWQSLLLTGLIAFYVVNFGFRVATEKFPYYGQDYLAFWSAGKVADTVGYSQIYDLQEMRIVEGQVLKEAGAIQEVNDPSFLTLPALYLPVFLVPFQLLSRLPIQISLIIWWTINFLLLIGYLAFFIVRMGLTKYGGKSWIFPLILLIFSYPVFDNFLEGQINVFLLIFVGEFIRNAAGGRLFVSGMWLAGLLLKPQLLIIVLPIIVILRYWRVVYGFIASLLFLLATSWALSGTEGIIRFTNLLIRASNGAATSSPQYMINWRMVGTLLIQWTNSNLGWIVAGLGMLATLAIVIYLIKDRPALGSNAWLMAMAGVFSATLALTWHAHNHMAMVLIPLLFVSFASGLLPKKTMWAWVLIPVIAWVGAGLIGSLWIQIMPIEGIDLLGVTIPVAAFLANLSLINGVLIWKKTVSKTRGANPSGEV